MQSETEDSISIEEETQLQIGGMKDESTQIKQVNPNFMTYSHLQELLNQEEPILPDEETISYQVPSRSVSSNLTNPSNLSQFYNKFILSVKQPSLSEVSKTIQTSQSDPFAQFNSQSQTFENNSDLQYSISQVYDAKEENNNNLMPEINEVSDAEEDSSFNNPEKSRDNIIDSEIYQKYVEKLQGFQDSQLNENNQQSEQTDKSPNQQQKYYLDGLSMQQSEVIQSQTYSNHSSGSQRVQILTQRKASQKNGLKALSLQSNPNKLVASESESITPNDKNSNVYTYDDDKLELIIELQNEIEDLEEKIKGTQTLKIIKILVKDEGIKKQDLEYKSLKIKIEDQQKQLIQLGQRYYCMQIKNEMDYQQYVQRINKLQQEPQQNQQILERIEKLEKENQILNDQHSKDSEEILNLSKVIKEFIVKNDELKNQVKNIEKEIHAKEQLIDQLKENDNINVKKQEDFIATIARLKNRISSLEKTQSETFKHLTLQQQKLKKSEKLFENSGERSYELQRQPQKSYFDQTLKSQGTMNQNSSQLSSRNISDQSKFKQLTMVHTTSNGSKDLGKIYQKNNENKFIQKIKDQVNLDLITRKSSQGNQLRLSNTKKINKKPFLNETNSNFESYCEPIVQNYVSPMFDLKFRNPISTYLAYQQNQQKFTSINNQFTHYSQPKIYGISQPYNQVISTIF